MAKTVEDEPDKTTQANGLDSVEESTFSLPKKWDSLRRSPRWERQRDNILAAAGRLFRGKGYLGTSVNDIADAANTKKPAVYYYFDTKADILYEVATRTMQALMALASPILDSEMPLDRKLEALVTRHINWQISHIGFAGIGQSERSNLPPDRLRAYINMRDEYEAIFRRVIKEGVDGGIFRPIDPKLASLFVLGFMNSIVQWFNPKGPLSPEDVASEAYEFVSGYLKVMKPGAGPARQCTKER
jgi:AcrR family transcriptional regulator